MEDEVGQSKGKPQELCTLQKRDRLMGMRSLSGMVRIFSTIPGTEQKGQLQGKGQEKEDEKGIAELSRRIFLGANIYSTTQVQAIAASVHATHQPGRNDR